MNYVNGIEIGGKPTKQNPSIVGYGPPTTATEGAVGFFYMDRLTGNTYKCIAAAEGVFTWILFSGVEAANVSHFGAPYTSAERDINLNEEKTVKLYLFPAAEGYDAVVAGEGAIKDHAPYGIDNSGNLILGEDDRQYDVGKISRLHIEAGVTSIGDFFMCRAFNLKHLSFGASEKIEHIGKYAFSQTQIGGAYDFSGLEQEVLHNSFECCPKLVGLKFNEKLKTINSRSFRFCLNLRYVDGVTGVTKIGDGAFHAGTCLECLDVEPGRTQLGKWVFTSTSADARVGNSKTVTEDATLLVDAEWETQGELCFVQKEWTDYLTAIRNVNPASAFLTIPETDNQKADFYKGDWKPLLQVYQDMKDRRQATGGCFFFSLYHVYNIMHPNAQYDTFYDFVTKGIAPHKIKVNASLRQALENSGILEDLIAVQEAYDSNVKYNEGDEISPMDLPVTIDRYSKDSSSEGTLFWGMRQIFGWGEPVCNLFGTYADDVYTKDPAKGAEHKAKIISEIVAGRPVIMEIVYPLAFAGESGHGMHAVTAIGYDQKTDKLQIIDSTWEIPSDIVPMVYWVPFETLISPDDASAIWTFNFGEEITMADIDGKLGDVTESNARIEGMIAALNSGFRVESGVLTVTEDIVEPVDTKDEAGNTVENIINTKITCTVGGNTREATAVSASEGLFDLKIPVSSAAKLFTLAPDEDTTAAIRGLFVTSKEYKAAVDAGTIEQYEKEHSLDVRWSTGVLGNCCETIGFQTGKGYAPTMDVILVGSKYYWNPVDAASTCTNADGFTVRLYALKAGTYNFTAYYWNK